MTEPPADPAPGVDDKRAGEDAPQVSRPTSDDAPPPPEEVAPAAALARARAAARSRGLRPGLKPRRRVRDVPVSQRGDAARDPALLGDQLERFVAERGWQVDVAVGAVVGRWPQIVGAEVAEHCVPADFVDGVLTVRADSTAWATQLRMLRTSLLGRLAEEVGEGTVTELRVLGPGAPSWSRGARRAQDGRGPRDTYG
ncbi:MAG: DUF721 domain-containing protein [Dermatophilaceae bacterium]